ncbi:unnamed protein product [Caenorhabditis bovis]|uniref:Glucosidase II subunit alpha n=1 Tax=Caenorhabditis bovis TaxID=2654633 RepID=A0A8S1E7D9_9PELO|nr:unnamed protein product [Caenorhabditis bovis]
MAAGSSWIVLAFLLPAVIHSVKREDFKTCEQSSFCKRHRAITEPTRYEVIANSVSHEGATWTAVIQNPDNKLRLKVTGVKDGTIRVQIDETEAAIRKRFVAEGALSGPPEQLPFAKVENSQSQAILTSGDGRSKAIIVFKPFSVNIYNQFDELVAQLNRDGKLKVEEFRTKEEGKEYPEGFWEESFKSFRDSKPFGSSSVGVDISFVSFKNAYGLPEHADSLALRNTVGNSDPYRLFNLDVFEYELNNPMALYVSVPYIFAHRANRSVGALWLNAAETWVDTQSSVTSKGVLGNLYDTVTGKDTNDVPHFDAHFMSESGLVDVFFFVGPTVRDVQRQNSKLTGVTPLPPLFAIAYHQCRWNYNDEQDVAKVNQGFDDWKMPMDVIWLDIEHTDGKRYFTWDKHKFAHAKEMIEGLAAKGRKLVTIVDPHIKKDDGYFVYKDAKDLGLFVKKSDGTTDYEGHCWPGASEYLDFWHPQTRAYWKEQFAFDRYVGSTPELFIWNDMNEPSVFSGPEISMDRDAIHYGGIEHREVHNMYGMMYHSATFDGLLARTNGQDRPFILSRSGFIGTQRTAAIWTGDNTADWGHLEISVPMLLSLSIAGIPFVGADVGGFFGNPDEQLLTRWYQAAAFQPFFRAHAHIDTKRREPWLFSEPTRNSIRESLRARYALLPYWYTLFQEHTQNGMPPMRPLFYEFENDESVLEEQKQWMVGSDLLVRPVLEKDTYNVKVELPKGDKKNVRWYEWVSGIEHFEASAYVDAPIDFVPVFQRGGSIIPTWQRIRRSAYLMKDDPLTLFVALDSDGNAKGEVYLDDGKTHSYRNDEFVRANFTFVTTSPTTASIVGEHVDGKYAAKNWIERIVVRGIESSPKSVEITRISDPFEPLEYSYNRDNKVLIIRKPEVLITNSYRIHLKF